MFGAPSRSTDAKRTGRKTKKESPGESDPVISAREAFREDLATLADRSPLSIALTVNPSDKYLSR